MCVCVFVYVCVCVSSKSPILPQSVVRSVEFLPSGHQAILWVHTGVNARRCQCLGHHLLLFLLLNASHQPSQELSAGSGFLFISCPDLSPFIPCLLSQTVTVLSTFPVKVMTLLPMVIFYSTHIPMLLPPSTLSTRNVFTTLPRHVSSHDVTCHVVNRVQSQATAHFRSTHVSSPSSDFRKYLTRLHTTTYYIFQDCFTSIN